MNILSPKDYKKMPWKNGKGTTTEIAIYPPDSTLNANNFIWRLSSAEISESGNFSEFSDCNRSLIISSGNGVRLTFSDNEKTLLAGEVFNFDGSKKIHCALINGPVHDVGLISKKDHVRTEFQLLEKNLKEYKLQKGTHIILSVAGKVRIETTTGTWTLETLSTAILNTQIIEDISIEVAGTAIYLLISIFDKNKCSQ